ncbi:unnamed protein product, partial [Brenthis ino]
MATVTLSQGKLKGGKAVSDNGTPYYEFLGIPYAKPPLGNLRFKGPQTPEPWIGERDATTVCESNVCCQMDIRKGISVGSEDCLYLNVYTPHLPDANSNLLPVMVYIHGGGFIFGSGIIKQELGPDYIIGHNVVVVTINYRLGVIGFLSLDIPEASGNMGLKDQVFALKWVQENIGKFGGDRNNITIFGLSAGSASVDYLLLSSQSKGLFHKAILQSGSSLNHWAINYEPKKILVKLLEQMGYTGPMDNNGDIYEYLLASPLDNLLYSSFKVIENYDSNRLCFGFVPTIETDFGNGEAFITESPYKLFKEGRFNRVPVIKGFCNKEGYIMNILKPKIVLDLIENKDFTKHWSYSLDEGDKTHFNSNILNAYEEENTHDDDKDKIAVEFFGDLDFVSGIWISGQIIASKGVPVYFYEFNYDGKMNATKIMFGLMRKGAAHGDDIGYIFKQSANSKFCDGKDAETTANLALMWTNFAKMCKPIPNNEKLSIEWPEYKNESPAYLSIGEDFSIRYNYEPKKMAVFKDIYEKYQK